MWKPPNLSNRRAALLIESVFTRRILRECLTRMQIGMAVDFNSIQDLTRGIINSRFDTVLLDDEDLCERVINAASPEGGGAYATAPYMVLIMNETREKSIIRAITAGVDSIVQRPFSPRTICDHLRRLETPDASAVH